MRDQGLEMRSDLIGHLCPLLLSLISYVLSLSIIFYILSLKNQYFIIRRYEM